MFLLKKLNFKNDGKCVLNLEGTINFITLLTGKDINIAATLEKSLGISESPYIYLLYR